MDNPFDTERLEGRKLRVVVAEVINPLKLSRCIWLVLSAILADFQPFANLSDLNRARSELTTSVTILPNRRASCAAIYDLVEIKPTVGK